MKLRLLLTTCGNGCAGSRPIGVSSGLHLAPEVVGHPGALRGVALDVTQQPHARCCQRRQQLLVERAVDVARPARAPLRRCAPNSARKSCSVMPGGGALTRSCSLEARDADLEEFVEVAADDAQEAQPLEQRHAGSCASASTRRLNASSESSRLTSGRCDGLARRFGRHERNRSPCAGRSGAIGHVSVTLCCGTCYRRFATRRHGADASHRHAPFASRSSSTR